MTVFPTTRGRHNVLTNVAIAMLAVGVLECFMSYRLFTKLHVTARTIKSNWTVNCANWTNQSYDVSKILG
ncbi:hypothetical protein [Okeania sp. SIO2G5]|uniref:hypothetical protein n=1 Tax=Okeania sp. SIO2G5 TaxID=2607796 RepID=UPI0013C0363B|nr:hypothetical protein [Okeania sp. SIO2G5]NEP76273.1 hypothetical protein [Okeania sp. SIO2G5]